MGWIKRKLLPAIYASQAVPSVAANQAHAYLLDASLLDHHWDDNVSGEAFRLMKSMSLRMIADRVAHF